MRRSALLSAILFAGPGSTIHTVVDACFQLIPPASGRGVSSIICASDSDANSNTDNNNNSNNNNMCGEGFYQQTGPDGDYCVFDCDTAAAQFGTDMLERGLDSQNKARQKFGLPPLTAAEYVALQAQTSAMGKSVKADAVQAAFEKFDTNKDGVITVRELEQGIRAILETELSETAVQTVMEHLDTSGDGVLQPDEMVTLDNLRSRLQAVAREEQEQLALLEAKQAEPGIFQSFLQAFQWSSSTTDGNHENDNQGITCHSNFDCQKPEVCCDFHYKKICCSSGQLGKDMKLQYATVPVPQQY